MIGYVMIGYVMIEDIVKYKKTRRKTADCVRWAGSVGLVGLLGLGVLGSSGCFLDVPKLCLCGSVETVLDAQLLPYIPPLSEDKIDEAYIQKGLLWVSEDEADEYTIATVNNIVTGEIKRKAKIILHPAPNQQPTDGVTTPEEPSDIVIWADVVGLDASLPRRGEFGTDRVYHRYAFALRLPELPAGFQGQIEVARSRRNEPQFLFGTSPNIGNPLNFAASSIRIDFAMEPKVVGTQNCCEAVYEENAPAFGKVEIIFQYPNETTEQGGLSLWLDAWLVRKGIAMTPPQTEVAIAGEARPILRDVALINHFSATSIYQELVIPTLQGVSTDQNHLDQSTEKDAEIVIRLTDIHHPENFHEERIPVHAAQFVDGI